MSSLNKPENVENQYANDKNLSARITLHDKYSTNKYGFSNWLFDIYDFTAANNILELGCGTGAQWTSRLGMLPPESRLILSDLSMGMVETVRQKFEASKNVNVLKIDIQSIPFPDDSFDVIIANHMLYHVPELHKALSEVVRVLKPGGTFYATTIGSGGMRLYLHLALKQVSPRINAFNEDVSFTIQNGTEILGKHFLDVKRYDYEDSLLITDVNDLIEWIKSAMQGDKPSEMDLEAFYNYFEGIRSKAGAISIPKEAGIFVSKKSGKLSASH